MSDANIVPCSPPRLGHRRPSADPHQHPSLHPEPEGDGQPAQTHSAVQNHRALGHRTRTDEWNHRPAAGGRTQFALQELRGWRVALYKLSQRHCVLEGLVGHFFLYTKNKP